MIKAVIFDLDGLIVDTESIENQAYEKLLKEYGKTPQYFPNGLIHIVGTGHEIYDLIKEKYQIDDDVDTIRKKKRIYFEEIIRKGGLKPYDGFFELLDELKKSDLKIALASNRFINFIDIILTDLRVKENFEVIVGPSETRRHKPHPDIYLEAAKQLGIEPKFCLALEDTDRGIESAVSAGMKVIAVPNEFTKEYDLSKADKVVNSLKSVTIELVKSL